MREQLAKLTVALSAVYDEAEAVAIAYALLENVYHLTRMDIACGRASHDSDCKGTQKNWNTQENHEKLQKILSRILRREPLQYVLGETEWMGMRLRVTPATLIPRPETAELLGLIRDTLRRDGYAPSRPVELLDIGTGSGCLALGLKSAHPAWQVWACDVSGEALDVARENARSLSLDVHFFLCDVLRETPSFGGSGEALRVVVSNPPYICDSERVTMDDNVLLYEPHSALFVPDSDPLLFYRRIADLRLGDWLFFEINERFGEATKTMLEEMGYEAVEVYRDIYGKDRMVCGKLVKK